MNILTFLILALATYRVTHFLVIDKIFEPIRRYFVIRDFEAKPIPTYSVQGGPIRKFIGKMLVCYWCSGVWVAAVVIFGFYGLEDIKTSILLTFALAAVQSLIETIWSKSAGYPEMMEVPATVPEPTMIEKDDLSAARSIKNAFLVTIGLALIIYGFIRLIG